MQEAPPQPPPPSRAVPPPAPAETRCPVCGTPAAPGQEFCLNCGSRLTPHYRRPPSWRLVATLAALGVLAVGAGVGAAIGLTSGGHKKTPVETTTTTTQGAAPAPAPAPPTAAPPTAPGATTPGKPGAVPPPAGGAVPGPTPGKPAGPPPTVPGGATWPAGKTGYTVDLVETRNQKEAVAKAEQAIKKGIPAGVLQSDAYQTLPPGLYVVFAGQYKTAGQATAAANGYAKKGFGAAYGRLIQPKR